jgi:hypothetical protein
VPLDRLVERSSHSGDELTKANCGVPETDSRRLSVRGCCPGRSASSVTTPVWLEETVDVLDELLLEADVLLEVVDPVLVDDEALTPAVKAAASCALTSVKSAWTVLEMVPVAAVAVR